MKYSLYLVLTFLTISWILFLLSVGTTSWLNIKVVDTVIIPTESTESKLKTTLTLEIGYNFGLSTYCVKAKNHLLNKTDVKCMKIWSKHPDILKQLQIDQSVFSDIRKFMALTIVFTTLAVTSSIVGKICAQKSLHNIIAYVSMALILIAGIVCSASVFIANRLMRAEHDTLHTNTISKHGTFIVEYLHKGYSYYSGCAGIIFLALAFFMYIAEILIAKKNGSREKDEEIAYTKVKTSE